MPADKGTQRGLPEQFTTAEREYALYEDVAYEEYWDDPSQLRQDALEKYLISQMLPRSGHRIIDVGCGYGRLATTYIDRFDQVVLYDGSFSLLQRAREAVGDRAVLVAGDVGRLPFKPASFDCVLTIRVLQHMHDLQGAIEGMCRILARDGQFLFSYHNKRNAHRILHYPKSKRIADPFSLESAEVSPTLISHHPNRMAELLGGAGVSPPDYRGAVVVNSLARLAERSGSDVPSGVRWAGFAGKHKLAPWLIGTTTALGGEGLAAGGPVEDLFECPSCHGELGRSSALLECAACGREYPVHDGIVDFRL